MNTTEGQNNDYGMTLANGVYNNSVVLTSVCSLSGMWSSNAKADVYGIDNQDLSNNSQNTVCYQYVSLFGKKTSDDPVSTNQYLKNQIEITIAIFYNYCGCYFNL